MILKDFFRAMRNRRQRRSSISFGSLAGVQPISDQYGFDRGQPIDRYYIEQFLSRHARDIAGAVLEVKDSAYTHRFGRAVTRCDVVDIDQQNPAATIVADLTAAECIPDCSFDCFVMTQTLHVIYDMRAVLYHAHRILRPGGALLVTVPVVSRIVPDVGLTDYWRLTAASATRLFSEVFPAANVEATPFGNVFACIASLSGLAVEDVDTNKLELHDSCFPLLIGIRAVRASSGDARNQ